jgi:hypothetical protein
VKSLALVVALAACGFEHGGHAGQGPNDGHVDAPPGDPDAMPDADPSCFGVSPFIVCPTAQPAQPLVINTNVNTSGTAPSCDNGRGVVMTVAGTESCVLAGTDISFSGPSTTGSSGSRPLVLIATGTITIEDGNTLDARSATTGTGPGSNPSDCGAASNGTASGGNGGGGAGGSFGSKGGNGAAAGGGTGGAATAAVTTPVNKLRGGCPGGTGAGNTVVAGGAGGGAVLVIAKTKIEIDGTLTVSGAGGLGGVQSKGGGGGGGSGGMIVLHAPTVTIGSNARLMANGGGGGGGAGANDSGLPGDDATMLGSAAAGGGTNGPGTTVGGAGAFKAQAAGTPANGGGGSGGGGGGGGVGVIRVLSGQTISGNNASPAPTS